MTAVSRSCAERNCPGVVDRDGFCRLWGHPCDGGPADPSPVPPAIPAQPVAAVRLESTPVDARPATASTRDLWPRHRPWERPATIPPPRSRSALEAVLPRAVVSENQRYCPRTTCRRRVPRVTGYCPSCGSHYTFTPPLDKGDLCAGRYRIEGCLGHGGVGWVFLARDEELNGRWRVLKGQRNPDDREAAAAFAAEREALIELSDHHPGIVTITDAIRPDDSGVGYLVMEYVDGGTLEDARRAIAPDGGPAAVDVPQALGYAAQILDAFAYLHGQGWLYCDLKPDNVVLVSGHGVDSRIKLVDFGAARQVTNTVSPPWGTAGFEAPEVQRLGPAGPSVRSDIYTVGRTLAALTLVVSSADLRPLPAGEDLLRLALPARLDPFARLLARATATDPQDRFGSAAEMREQVRGVADQVRAATDDVPRPSRSSLFGPSACAFALHVDVTADPVEIALGLPTPLVDGDDPAAGFLASLGPADPAELITLLGAAPERTAQVTYRMVRAYLAAGRADEAGPLLAELPADRRDWSLWWHRGLVALVGGDVPAALDWFERVYGWLPGEVSARLAYAVTAELHGDHATAAAHYRGVWQTDQGVVAAVFGLARCLRVTEDPRRAAAILLTVPEAARASAVAVTCAARMLLEAPDDQRRLTAALDAADLVAKLPPFAERDLVEAYLLRVALDSDRRAARDADRLLFGHRLDETDLRRALDRVCRRLAARTADRRERIALIDHANANRPVTWW
ncbi:protein kinase [Micromonospora sp. WMMD882]|uniref:serine/threonine-protein kinase n=1 Tax=Micromonospora sp. WMMD882 TaxID=3015151 RepID=UPI00248AA56E|nr:serine/threonine-protein kinase [Micromonospora sp. WMMD882]WBB80533.1 protein kinase [Micromonospora sp. WMMD882]